MTFDAILKDLKNKIYHPVYFLQGEEPYYIDAISDYIESHVLDDGEKEFNCNGDKYLTGHVYGINDANRWYG